MWLPWWVSGPSRECEPHRARHSHREQVLGGIVGSQTKLGHLLAMPVGTRCFPGQEKPLCAEWCLTWGTHIGLERVPLGSHLSSVGGTWRRWLLHLGLKDLWQKPRAPSEAAQGLQQLLSAPQSTCRPLPAPPASPLVASRKGRPGRECGPDAGLVAWPSLLTIPSSLPHICWWCSTQPFRGAVPRSVPVSARSGLRGSLSLTACSRKRMCPSARAEAGARSRRRAVRGSPAARRRR